MLRCCPPRPQCLQLRRLCWQIGPSPIPTSRNRAARTFPPSRGIGSLLLQSRKLRSQAGRLIRLRRSGRRSPRIGIRERIRAGVQWPQRHAGRRWLIRAENANTSISLKLVQTHARVNVGSATGPAAPVALVKRPKRTKYVSLGSWTQKMVWNRKDEGLDHYPPAVQWSFDASWSARFASVARGGSPGMATFNLSNDHRIDMIIGRYASRQLSAPSLYQAWMHLPSYVQPRLWQDVMLWCLKYSPIRALKILHATYRGTKFRPSRLVVGDCLEHLARHFHFVEKPDTWALATIHHLTIKFVAGGTDEEKSRNISCQMIYLIIQQSDDSKVLSLLRGLAAAKIQIHTNTLLHILDRAIRIGKLHLSMTILKSIADSGFNMSKDQVQMACVSILRAQIDVKDPYDIQTKLLTQMLEIGIRPKLRMYNAILLNTVEARDLDVAWQMYDMARLNNLDPDPCTYGILLKGVLSRSDLAGYERIFREVGNDAAALENTRLMGDLLNAISIRLQRMHQQPFPHMLKFYKNHFDLRPLLELDLYRIDNSSPEVLLQRKWPTPAILGQMVCSYIKSHEYAEDLVGLYERYRRLVHQNHPIITPLAETDHVANAFVLAFGKRSKSLPHCTTVIRHMLDDAAAATGAAGTDQGISREESDPLGKPTAIAPNFLDRHDRQRPRFSAPTVRTWSILAAAYFRHKQKLAAEKVLALMKERDIKYDKVTWNTIVCGFSSLQDVEKAVDAMKRMQVNGFGPDSRTLKGLSRSYNRMRLLNALGTALDDAQSAGSLQAEETTNESPEPAECSGNKGQDRAREVDRYLQEWHKDHSDLVDLEDSLELKDS